MGVDLSEQLRRAADEGSADERARARAMSALSDDETSVANRFVVRRKLGSGAQGRVYAAFDESLGRDVAIKRVDARRGHATVEAEARALAKLQHPNLVVVFELIATDDEHVLVMELAHGVELGRWLRAQPRSRDEILDVFIQVGRGLAALHEAGLVHMDVKPSNVMVDGTTTKIVDLGLSAEVRSSPSRRGTPRYMAPEQKAGARVDGRADQYAFCVALLEALTNRSGVGDRRAMARLPRRLQRALRRGLEDRPQRRHPSMVELVAELRPVRGRAATTAACAGSATVALTAFAAHTTRQRACETAAQQIDVLWSDEAQAQLGRALGAVDDPAAGRWTATQLDGFARQWQANRRAACEARPVLPADPTPIERCHDLQLDRFDAILDTLLAASPEVLDRSDALLLELPSPDACAQPLPDWYAEPQPDALARTLKVRRLVHRAALPCRLRSVEACDEAVGRATDAATDVPSCLWEPELDLLAGYARQGGEDRAGAAARVQRAAATAEICGLRPLEVAAKTAMIWIAADGLGDYDVAAMWATQAQTAALRASTRDASVDAGRPYFIVDHETEALDCRTRGELLDALAGLAKRQADYETGRRVQVAALEDSEACFGLGHPRTAGARSALARFELAHGREPQAREHAEAALRLMTEVHGEHHPETANAGQSLAQALARSEPERALQLLEDSARVYRERGTERRHSYVGALSDQAGVLLLMERFAEAQSVLEQAVAAAEGLHEASAPWRAELLNNLANAHLAQAQYDQAVAGLQTAERLLHGTDDSNATKTNVVANLGIALLGVGRHEDAADRLCPIAERLTEQAGSLNHRVALITHYCAEAHQGLDRAPPILERLVAANPDCEATAVPELCRQLHEDHASVAPG